MHTENKVLIWDPLVRMFHWLLVMGVALLFVLEDEVMALHVMVGYGVLGLLFFRTAWGWVGPTHARFRAFVRSPWETLAYLKTIPTGQAPRFLGHNPAGGMMVILLMATLFVTILLGILAYATEQGGGFLSGVAFALGGGHAKWFEEAHELFAGFLLLLVAFHVGGVLFTSLHQHENLIKSMFTGYKFIQEKRS